MKTNKGFVGTLLLIIIGVGLIYGGWMLLSKNVLSLRDIPDKEIPDSTLPTATTTIVAGDASTTPNVATTTPDVLKTYTLTTTSGKYSFKYLSPKFTLGEDEETKGAVTLKTADDAIRIKMYPIAIKSGAYKTALINDVVFDGSGKHPNSFTEFSQRTIGTKDFYYIKTGLFEGVLGLHYYYVGAKEALVFEVVSQGVDWTNPKLDIENDKGSLAMKELLKTFVVIK